MPPQSKTMNDFYIILSSNHSRDYFTNFPGNFRAKLNNTLRLGEGWKVGICQFKTTLRKNIYVCSNICTSSIVGPRQLNLLRHITTDDEELMPFYMPLSGSLIDNIHISILDDITEEEIYGDEGVTHLTLHFVYNP